MLGLYTREGTRKCSLAYGDQDQKDKHSCHRSCPADTTEWDVNDGSLVMRDTRFRVIKLGGTRRCDGVSNSSVVLGSRSTNRSRSGHCNSYLAVTETHWKRGPYPSISFSVFPVSRVSFVIREGRVALQWFQSIYSFRNIKTPLVCIFSSFHIYLTI